MKEITLKLTVDETNAVLNALGDMPFAQVHQLIQHIQQQASQQLKEPQNGTASTKDKKDKKEAVTA